MEIGFNALNNMVSNNIPGYLRYTNANNPGFYRKPSGKIFIYQNEKGEVVKAKSILNRIEKLVIPPQWKNVWISADPRGHIQAVGYDKKDRKQYIYHPLWKSYISEYKYNKLINFAQALPKIRKPVEKDLRKKKWSKEKVVALSVKLMDEFLLRVGNKKYQKENGTYGLTTLRKKHLKESKNGLIIKYKAKSGKLRKVNVEHPVLIRLLKKCSELPGYEIFRYATNDKYVPIDSQDINEYLKQIFSENFTAKSFRTWGGTVLALKFSQQAYKICQENPRRKLETTIVKLVAAELNNTVSVCRKYYIHPSVLKYLSNGHLEQIQQTLKRKANSRWFSAEEKMVLKIINSDQNNNRKN